MVPRAPFLKTRFGGYYHRDTPEEDVELTHVGPVRRAGSTCAASGSPSASPPSCGTCRTGSRSWGGARGIPRPERRCRIIGAAMPAPRHVAGAWLTDANGSAAVGQPLRPMARDLWRAGEKTGTDDVEKFVWARGP